MRLNCMKFLDDELKRLMKEKMIYLIFILFILYTIACCMDGPDLKPLWKTWLGKKLYDKAKYFWPELTYIFMPTEPPKVEYYKTTYEPVKLQCRNRISEIELYEQKMYGISSEDPKTYCINRAKENCIESLMYNIKNSGLIDTQVIEDPLRASINVIAEIKLMKQQ